MKHFFFSLLTFLCVPLFAFAAAKYDPLIKIPGLTDGGDTSFSSYINFLYALSISLAALLAVIKIIVAGVKYMLSASVGTKGNAKSEIQGALLGLLLILGAYIILNTINPRLIEGGVQFKTLAGNPAKVTDVPVKVGNSNLTDQGNQIVNNSLKANSTSTVVNRTVSTNTILFPNIPVLTSSDATNNYYVLDSSRYRNTPNIAFEMVASFERKCKAAGGSFTKKGAEVSQCVVKK